MTLWPMTQSAAVNASPTNEGVPLETLAELRFDLVREFVAPD